MTFISYARNFEDVMLWRALKSAGPGFYVDVGARHPDIDSVTRALYDHGWSGVNVAPAPAFARLLELARPRDVTLHAALGADEAGTETLAAVCRQHATSPVHLLRIDAGGAEQAVLAGADFTAFRPWIVLVAAETHTEWEPSLLGAGFRFTWFDGLNRFYVSAEKEGELAPSFRVPPNVLDEFVRPADTEAARLLGRAEALARDATTRAEAAEQRVEALALRMAREAAAHAELERLYRERTADRHALAKHVHTVTEQALYLINVVHALRNTVSVVRSSASWRLTEPLRRVISRLRGTSGDPPLFGFDDQPPAPPAAPPMPELATAEPLPFDRAYDRPLRTVHQYHSDSAPGDAVTTSMLLIRGLLRRAGFRSNIYVANRPAALVGELLLLDHLPQGSGYVLIVHHSMGQATLPRMLALPVPKILIYHNITPARDLPTPSLREAARIGREQLAQMRLLVAAALADSEFNATELRSLGFDPVRTCTLLFDPARLTRPFTAREPEQPFTVLFVGRVVESKGQTELVEAFARFRQCFGPARLVLVGRSGGEGNLYAQALEAAISRHGLREHVLVTGPVSDEQRDRWYGRADLYVSLSRHEGFGVPLVEAMANGVPVLAWPVGAVADTLGGAGELLADPSPAAVAAAMLRLARDPGRRAAMAAAGRRTLSRFEVSRHLPRLLDALVRAGADLPPDDMAGQTLAGTMRFTVAGHVNGVCGLAAVNRTLAATLDAARPGRVRVQPVEGEPVQSLEGVPGDERHAVARLAAASPDAGPEVVVSQHDPLYVPPNGGDLPLAMMFWDESLLPAATVETLARFRGVLAPSRFVAKALVDSGVAGPVCHLPFAPRLQPFLRLERRRRGDRTVFLHVSACLPGNGVDLLLAAYARAFTREDNVELVIKGRPDPHNDIPEQIEQLLSRYPGMPPVRYIGRELEHAELLELYASADAMVLPTRGEGFNIPAAEALAAGLPLIVTGFGGHRDFCGPDEARLLRWRFQSSRSHLATPGSVWAEPDGDDLQAAMRELAADPEAARERAGRGRVRIAAMCSGGAFSGAAFADGLTAFAARLLAAPPAAPVRAAWVSTWGVRCGVAEYSRRLLEHVTLDGLTVVADTRPPDPDVSARLPPIPAERVWTLGEAFVLSEIPGPLARLDPDVVVVQHQPALMGWAVLGELLRRLRSACHIPAVAALHDTRCLVEVGEGERTAALDGLREAARVLVHTPDDLNRLRRLGLVDNVTLLPHGAVHPRAGRPARTLSPGDPVLIGCYGFLLPDKGVPELVLAMASLRRRRPQARLRLVNACHPAQPSHLEREAVRSAVDRHGLGEAVELLTDFLPNERSLDLLAECDLLALPHQSSQEAASAALRTALSAGVPVAVTPLPLFDEAADAVLKLPGFSPAEIADGIDTLLDDPAARDASVAAARTWTEARSWEGVGGRLTGMLRHLARSGAARDDAGPLRSRCHEIDADVLPH